MKKYIVGGIVAVVGIALVVWLGAFIMNKVEARQLKSLNQAQYTMIEKQVEASTAPTEDYMVVGSDDVLETPDVVQREDIATREEVLAVAFESAGVVESEVRDLEVKLKYELEDDDDYFDHLHPYVYEIEFDHNGTEYEFTIDAQTKEILEHEIDN